MIARQLESIIANKISKTSVSHRSYRDITERFEILRGNNLLPRGRIKNSKHLSLAEITAGILSVVSEKPGFAALASIGLIGLCPVGGINASFNKSSTFSEAIQSILSNKESFSSLLEVRISDSEIYTNSHCRASIEYISNGEMKIAHYVSEMACSLLQEGAEKTFDPKQLINSVITETVFYPRFFKSIIDHLKVESQSPPVVYPEEEDDKEILREQRFERLEIKPDSHFLNMGIDTQVTWPKEESLVHFEGYKLVLMPKTKDSTTSIHMDLHGNKISAEDARTIMNRFLSMLCWHDDQYAVIQGGWSGNPVPVAVPKRDLAFSTAYNWALNKKLPGSAEAKKAIAIYREGRNAEQNFLISYAVLAYYKIIELRYKGRSETRTWFRNGYEKLKGDTDLQEEINSFEKDRGNKTAESYLYDSCRSAVAHANKPYSSDPDDLNEIRRLHIAAGVLRPLARMFIREELGVHESF